MKYQQTIATILALGLTTAAIAGEFSISSVKDIQAIIMGPSNSGSSAEGTADSLADITDVTRDNSDDQFNRNPDRHYQRYVGLGFDLGESNRNSQRGPCNGSGSGNRHDGMSYCGDPSPSD